MGKYSLLVIGGLVIAAGTITSNLNQVSEYFVDDVIEHYERSEAGLVANSMAHMSLAMLKDSSSWRGGYNGIAIGEGTGWSTLDDNTTDTTLIAGHVRITAWGTSGGTADTATVIVKFPTIPPGVCAGVTAHSDVVGRGKMVIDGRNHDLNGIVIAGEGTFGVSTVATLTQKGNAKVGGTAAGIDYPPSKSPPSSIIDENATCDGACDSDSEDSDSEDSDSEDSDSEDSGSEDSGSEDSGSEDSGSEDSGSEDSGSEDSGSEDSGSEDSGSEDGDSEDGDSEDSGSEDSGSEDSGSEDSDCEDSGSEDSGSNSGKQGLVWERLPDKSIGPRISCATLTFTSQDGTLIQTVVSDESGRYKIELARGRYTVTAEHPDFLPYSTGNGFSFVTGIGYQTFNIFMHRAPNIGDSEDGDSEDGDSEDSDSEDSDSTDVACGTSPDAIFGYASGTLKALAQAGANGSQYATDPASLTFPLSSVTFVELADGATWSAIHFGESTGVLVVHNSACNARMKNLNSGTFKGLIISDDIVKVHTTVIGAVVSMTQSPSGNCIGNGNGEVLYSIAALENASLVSVGGGGELTVVSWLE